MNILSAKSHVGGRDTSFGAIDFELGTGTGKHEPEAEAISLVFAELEEIVGRVRITKSAVLLSKPGIHPETATVTLSKPFAGAASYLESPGSPPYWTGTLGVHLPGAGAVPLVGPDFSAAICRARSLKDIEKCDLPGRSSGAPSRQPGIVVSGRPQGSGSQSQAFWDARLSWSR